MEKAWGQRVCVLYDNYKVCVLYDNYRVYRVHMYSAYVQCICTVHKHSQYSAYVQCISTASTVHVHNHQHCAPHTNIPPPHTHYTLPHLMCSSLGGVNTSYQSYSQCKRAPHCRCACC